MEGLSKSPAVFDYEKLNWFNSEYIKKMDDESYNAKAMPVLDELCPEYINTKKLAELLKSRIYAFCEITERIGFVLERLDMDTELYTNKKNKTTPEGCKEILTDCLPLLRAAESWDNDTLFELLKDYAASTEKKSGAVMWAIRIAIARLGVTPGGATELMEVFGKDETISRIEQAISEL